MARAQAGSHCTGAPVSMPGQDLLPRRSPGTARGPWTGVRKLVMVFCMKTTLVIDDGVMRRIKQEAARRGATISHLVESALRRYVHEVDRAPASSEPSALPTFAGGRFAVDVSNREVLDHVLGEG